MRGDSEGAIKALKHAIKLDKKFSYAYLLLGLEYSNRKQYESSRDMQIMALHINPKQYNSCIALGDIYTTFGNPKMALLYYTIAHKIRENCPVTNYRLGRFYVKKDPKLAFKYYHNSCKLNGKNLAYRYGCVIALISMKEYSMALDELDKIQDLFPVEAVTYILLGIVYEKMNRIQEALFSFSKAQDLKNSPKNVIKSLIGETQNYESINI